jgi:hypothetical protein
MPFVWFLRIPIDMGFSLMTNRFSIFQIISLRTLMGFVPDKTMYLYASLSPSLPFHVAT